MDIGILLRTILFLYLFVYTEYLPNKNLSNQTDLSPKTQSKTPTRDLELQ